RGRRRERRAARGRAAAGEDRGAHRRTGGDRRAHRRARARPAPARARLHRPRGRFPPLQRRRGRSGGSGMRNIGLILSRELGSYVRTPSAYFIAAAVLLVDGLLFNAFAVGERRLSAEVLQIFFYFAGIVTMGGGVLFSMRLLAEDRWTGTDVLLFTSP